MKSTEEKAFKSELISKYESKYEEIAKTVEDYSEMAKAVEDYSEETESIEVPVNMGSYIWMCKYE